MAAPATKARLGDGPPMTVRLDTGWEVKFDPEDAGRDGGWENGRWEEDWQDVTVPHVFNPKPIDDQFLGTIAWYRMRLRTPPTPARLRLGAALRGRTARRDGVAERHEARPAQGPVRAVRARRARTCARPGRSTTSWSGSPTSAPRTPARAGGTGAASTRPVYLEPVGRVQWDDLGILSDVDCQGDDCSAIVRTDGWVTSHTDEIVDVALTVRMTSPSGDTFEGTVTAPDVRPEERRRVGFEFPVDGDPALWSPDEPNLYAAEATVTVEGAVQQVVDRRIGLRYVRVRDGRLFLNGNELQLRGASIQEDVPGRGPALRDEDVETHRSTTCSASTRT